MVVGYKARDVNTTTEYRVDTGRGCVCMCMCRCMINWRCIEWPRAMRTTSAIGVIRSAIRNICVYVYNYSASIV